MFSFFINRSQKQLAKIVITHFCDFIPKFDICALELKSIVLFRPTPFSFVGCWPRESAMARHTYHEGPDNRKKKQSRRNEKPRRGRQSNRGGVWHEHKCKWCGLYYAHFHPMKYYDHPQFKYQCPNKDCEAYHQRRNETRAYLIYRQNY